MNNTTVCDSVGRALEDYEMESWIPLLKDVVSVLGIAGNVVLSVVRMQGHLRNRAFNRLLVTLAVFDSLTLATALMYSTMHNDKGTNMNAIPRSFQTILYSVNHSVQYKEPPVDGQLVGSYHSSSRMAEPLKS